MNAPTMSTELLTMHRRNDSITDFRFIDFNQQTNTDIETSVVRKFFDIHPKNSTTVFRIPLEIRQTESRVVISDPQTGIFGSGINRAAAIKDFAEALVDFKEVLADSEPLSDELRQMSFYLRSIL